MAGAHERAFAGGGGPDRKSARAGRPETGNGRAATGRPARLNSAEAERLLGLAAGQWRSRGLFALRARASLPTPDQPIRKGDYLIVEPGARERPGRLVVIEADGGYRLQRIDHDAAGRVVLTSADPSLLPFPQPLDAACVAGTVIAVLPQATVRQAGGADGQPELLAAPPAATDVALLRELAAWQRWAAKRAVACPPGRDDEHAKQRAHWKGIANHAATLHACIETSQDARLRAALACEARKLISTLARRTSMVGPAVKARRPAVDRRVAVDGAPRREPDARTGATHTGNSEPLDRCGS